MKDRYIRRRIDDRYYKEMAASFYKKARADLKMVQRCLNGHDADVRFETQRLAGGSGMYPVSGFENYITQEIKVLADVSAQKCFRDNLRMHWDLFLYHRRAARQYVARCNPSTLPRVINQPWHKEVSILVEWSQLSHYTDFPYRIFDYSTHQTPTPKRKI